MRKILQEINQGLADLEDIRLDRLISSIYSAAAAAKAEAEEIVGECPDKLVLALILGQVYADTAYNLVASKTMTPLLVELWIEVSSERYEAHREYITKEQRALKWAWEQKLQAHIK